MFARLSRLLRAWMGFFISMGEDPEVMLQDAIEEMRITMPKLNSVLVATRATVIRLEEELLELRRQDKNLTASIQAALREGTAAARSELAVAVDVGSTQPAFGGDMTSFVPWVSHEAMAPRSDDEAYLLQQQQQQQQQ